MKKEKIKLDKRYSQMGQYGDCEDEDVFNDFYYIEKEKNKYAKAIGNLIISFSNMEDSLDIDFSKSIHDSSYESGYRIIKYLSFRDKINLLNDDYIAFIKYCCTGRKQEKLLSELGVIYSKLVELSEFRNKIAHANWYSLNKNGFVVCRVIENKEEAGMLLEKVKMTPGVLIKFTRQNDSIANKLSEFRERVWDTINKEEYKSRLKHLDGE